MHRDEDPRPSDRPTVGYFKVRLHRNAPWRAAEIVCNHGLWTVFVAGRPTTPEGCEDPWRAPMMERVAFSPRITAAEHAALLADDRETRVDWHSDPPLY